MLPAATSCQANTDDKDEPMLTASSDRENNISSENFPVVQVNINDEVIKRNSDNAFI